MINERAPTIDDLASKRVTLERICATHGATNIRVTGSVAAGCARPDSDIDLVVDVDQGHDLLDTVELVLDLQLELGRSVDVLCVYSDGESPTHSPARDIVAKSVTLGSSVAQSPIEQDDRDRRLLGDLRRSIDLARSYADTDPTTFMSNDMAVDATKHQIAEIADICRRFSPELKARHSSIRWSALVGLPIATRHGPRGCWEVVTFHLAPLNELIQFEAL